jgi:hypothetical protein
MTEFCLFWRITPTQFWDLDVEDYYAMVRRMERYAKEQDQ